VATLAHARNAVVAFTNLPRQQLGIDDFSIVAHMHSDLLLFMVNSDRDLFGIRVPKGVTRGFTNNLSISSRMIGCRFRGSSSTDTWNATRI